MKKKLLILLCIFGVWAGFFSKQLHAQQIKLLGYNTLNGAVNGVLLGGATMALQNSDDFKPVQVGLGAGTLYGIGMGFYDISQINKGQQFYISGTFNDGRNSSILVLLDTIYGAAGGVIVASSVSLILQEPLLGALQYGSAVGGWAGFGFGLIDTFILAEGPNFGQPTASTNSTNAGGLISYSNSSENIELGMISLDIIQQKVITETNLKNSIQPTLNVLNLNIRF